MNFALFESMSVRDAQEHLQGFLATERCAMKDMVVAAEQAGIEMDYSLASLAPVLKWIASAIEIVRIPVPASEPEWIREFHKDGLIEFTDESKYLVLRAAYYLGECFVESSPKLHWDVGAADTIEKNMPVITGFRHEIQMATMMVCENVFGRIIGRGASDSHIDVMIDSWIKIMP